NQIHHHNTHLVPSNYQAKSYTEKALQDSIREMEMQCKERIELLETSKLSREESNKRAKNPLVDRLTNGESLDIRNKDGHSSRNSPQHAQMRQRGWIAEGNVLRANYPDLDRQSPSLPPHPGLSSRRTSSGL